MDGASSEGTRSLAVQRDAGEEKEIKSDRKRSRIPDDDERSINVPEQTPVKKFTFAMARKVRHVKEKMKPPSPDNKFVKTRAAETEHASDTKDLAEQMPPVKKSKVMVPSRGVEENPKPKHPSKSKSESGKGKQKIGKKRPLEIDDSDDVAELPAKKLKFLDCIKGNKLHAEFVAAIKSISSNTKEALMHPGKLIKDVSKYTDDFITDATEFTDGAIKLADVMLQPTSREKLRQSEYEILKGN